MRDIVVGSERLSLGKSIGKGGEGEVFAITGRPGKAVKIYSQAIRAHRERKVRAMVNRALSEQTKLVAYPAAIATDSRGSFLGFVMPLVAAHRPLHELYSPKSRQNYFPNADYRFLVRAALNVAKAVGSVHASGCIIGDLNHSGVLVSQEATIALIDADSFQFRAGTEVFKCAVGVADFTPPELHGLNLSKVERTLSHDNFGLAVAIFHLLFMGRHPYAGKYNGPDISLGEAIAQNRFAFSLARRSETRTEPPPNSLTLDLFPDPLRQTFERAFGISPDARPSATDWVNRLTQLEGSLNHCSKARTHYFPRNSQGCAWCNIEAASGFDMFPDLTYIAPHFASNVQGTDQAIKEIVDFRLPAISDILPVPSKNPLDGSDALKRAKRDARFQALVGMAALIGGGALMYSSASFAFIWFLLAGWGLIRLFRYSIDKAPFEKAYEDANKQLQIALDGLVNRSGIAEMLKVHAGLDSTIAAYRDISGAMTKELHKLRSSREARHKAAFLDRFSVRHASLPGIGPAKTTTLISWGIETAADIERWRVMAVPGFGPVMTDKLLDWRQKHELKFRYDSRPNAQDAAEEKALRAKFAAHKSKLEATIHDGLKAIRSAKQRLAMLPAKAKSDPRIIRALNRRAVAESDLASLGVPVPTANVILRYPDRPPVEKPNPPVWAVTQKNSNKATSPNCPRCGARMRRRIARQGRHAGSTFWGCSRYPQCKGIRN